MKPDAIPVRPLGSQAVLSPDGRARAVRTRTRCAARSPSRSCGTGAVWRRCPRRMAEAPGARCPRPRRGRVRDARGSASQDPSAPWTRLMPGPSARASSLPDGLARAWGVGATRPSVGPRRGRLDVPVESGQPLAVELERALWLGAGRPETARWIAGLDLAAAPRQASPPRPGPRCDPPPRGHRDRRAAGPPPAPHIRVGPDQIVTPAARSLAREWACLNETDKAIPDGGMGLIPPPPASRWLRLNRRREPESHCASADATRIPLASPHPSSLRVPAIFAALLPHSRISPRWRPLLLAPPEPRPRPGLAEDTRRPAPCRVHRRPHQRPRRRRRPAACWTARRSSSATAGSSPSAATSTSPSTPT